MSQKIKPKLNLKNFKNYTEHIEIADIPQQGKVPTAVVR
jgi:hypothetical protein